MRTAEAQEVLEAYRRALSREAHVLVKQPGVIWQQFYNRLHWQREPVRGLIEREEKRRSRRRPSAWMRLDTPLPEPGALVRVFSGHGGGPGQGTGTLQGIARVLACAFSPDGRRVVSGGADRTLRVWDAESGAELRTLPVPTYDVKACAWSPDGQIVAASCDDTIKLWDAESGAEVLTFGMRSTFDVIACAWSPDGGRICSGSSRGTLNIWDATTGAELQRVGIGWQVSACAWSPDGRQIVSGSQDLGIVSVWDAESGAEVRTLEGHTKSVNACAFSPDSRWIVSGSNDRTLKVWDAESGALMLTLEGHARRVSACAFSPDARWIVSASWDKTLKLWDAESGAEVRTLEGHTDYVEACAFSPDGGRIISAGYDEVLMLWDAEPEAEVRGRPAHDGPVLGCAFSPDGRWFVSGSEDRTLKVWDAESGAVVRTLKGFSGVVGACSFSPHGQWVAAAGARLRVFNAVSRSKVRVLSRHGAKACAWSPDGRWIVSAFESGTDDDAPDLVTVWDAQTGQGVPLGGSDEEFDEYEDVEACAWRPDGSRILVGLSATFGDSLRVFDAESHRRLRGFSGLDSVHDCAWSPDGRWLVSGGAHGALNVLDEETGAELLTLKGHVGHVNACAVSPDGRWIVSSGADRTLRVWSLEREEAVSVLPLPGRRWKALGLHPWLPRAVCGDGTRAVYRIELVGIEYGPIIVTAAEQGRSAVIRCRACWHEHTLEAGQLGSAMKCPTPGCRLSLRTNPFVLPSAPRGSGGGQR